jgi:hypothetical protein
MLKLKTGQKLAVCLTATAVASLVSAASSAAVIYENADSFTGQRTTGANGVPLGDVVNFAGTERTLTDVSFEYFLSPTRSGNETAVFSIYAANGNFPGALLYTSDPASISTGTTAEGYGRVNLSGINLPADLPNSIAYTITFGGLDTGETAGLLFHNDPTPVGTNPTFLDTTTGQQEHFTITQTGGTWQLINHDGVIDNLGIQFTAVPEPTTWALMLGGFAALGLYRRRK